MSIYVRKNNVTHENKEMPMLFPADRVYLDGDTDANLQEALTYSTAEHVVGKWIDGSILYEKTVDFGALPNNAVKTVAHNINFAKIISASGISATSDYAYSIPIPFTDTNLVITSTSISIQTTIDRSSFTKTYITIRYTKTV